MAYFELSYAFFWGFLVLIIAILGILRLSPGAVPAWAMPIIVILGSWMPNLAAVTVTGVLAGREGVWRGFALPRLQETYGPGKASLILGFLWNFWHLPLWLLSGYSGLDLLIYVLAFSVSIISLTFLFTWITSKTPNSLIPIVMTHFSFNASLNLVDARGLGLGPTLPLLTITAGIYLVTAVLVWSANGWSTRKRRDHSVQVWLSLVRVYFPDRYGWNGRATHH